MPGGRDAEERTGAVGPIEAPGGTGRPDRSEPLRMTVSESGGLAAERRLRAWWHHQGPRRRRLARGALGALAACAAALAVLLTRPAPGPPAPPPPWPAQAAVVTYAGIDEDGQGGPGGAFTIMLTVTNNSDAELRVTRVGQSYRGLSLTTAQQLPLLVPAGRPEALDIRVTITRCSLTPRADDLPFIDVTLSNLRAIQTQSEILGGSYGSDLHRAITTWCPLAGR